MSMIAVTTFTSNPGSQTSRTVVSLHRGECRSFPTAPGVRIICLEGSAWLTELGVRTDTVLHAGQSTALTRLGSALVAAQTNLRFAIVRRRDSVLLRTVYACVRPFACWLRIRRATRDYELSRRVL